jgi:putative membrane protein
MYERRLHRAGIVIAATEDLRQALMAVVVAGVVAGGFDSLGQTLIRLLGLGLLAACISAISGYVRWSTTTYAVNEGAARLRSGVFKRTEKAIPVERLQSIDESHGPIQRLFGVQQVRLQAAGSGKEAEIVLNALSRDEAAELRAALAAAPALRAGAAAGGRAAQVERLTGGQLVLAGLTSAQFGFLVPVAVAASQALDDVAEPLFGWVTAEGESASVAGVAAAVAAVLAAAWLVAFVGTLIAFGGFSVARRGDRLVIERGWIVRRRSSVPVARVQAVRLIDGLLRQPLGMTQMRLETAGYADERAYAGTLFPLLPRRDARRMLEVLLPELAADPAAALERPPGRAARRYALWPAVAGLAAGGGAAVALGPGGGAWLLAVAGAAAGASWGLARFRAAGFALAGGRVVVRSRLLARSTVIARPTSVDIRTASQSILQRRARLASLRFAIASKRSFGIAHVEERRAGEALGALAPGGMPSGA